MEETPVLVQSKQAPLPHSITLSFMEPSGVSVSTYVL